ncbi:unnamed protein product [Linum trigynum]|uniref:Uncharacterized protein n=1 Tax=Linum trigynum TaxID=586398 RepID=A0AAV2FID8_9ROSI
MSRSVSNSTQEHNLRHINDFKKMEDFLQEHTNLVVSRVPSQTFVYDKFRITANGYLLQPPPVTICQAIPHPQSFQDIWICNSIIPPSSSPDSPA